MLNSNSLSSSSKRYDDKVMDRFIPSIASQHNFRSIATDPTATSPNHHTGTSSQRLTGVQQIRDSVIFNLNETSINEGSLALNNSDDPSSTSATPSPNCNTGSPSSPNTSRDIIAEALNFTPQNRVLHFSPSSNFKKRLGPGLNIGGCNSSNTISSSPSSLFSVGNSRFGMDQGYTSARNSFDSNTSNISSFTTSTSTTPGSVTPRKKNKKVIKSHIPYRVLDAPSLRNDFYTNLISWSTSTNRIAVGLSSHVYIWSEEEGASLLDIPDDQTVSCVSFSNGEFIAVASKSGRISIFSQDSQLLLDQHVNIRQGICCISWAPNEPNKFYAGDEGGDVLLFEVSDQGSLKLIKQFKCHQQQVCGISVSYDGKQIAVGGNDNCCTIWDVQDQQNPTMKFFLPHQAAVKAIAYCPWSSSLLATGGGSKDRTIRYWHTNSGTLLETIPTKGQITSLIWSKRKKQIVVTFGFGDSNKPLLIGLYSYPKMEPVVQVEATPNLRILSAVMSPDSSSICVAANDETVRFYELWNPNDRIIVDSQEDGLYGSELIELCEGITKTGGLIR